MKLPSRPQGPADAATHEPMDPAARGATATPAVPARKRPALIGLGAALIAVCGLGGWAAFNAADETHPVVVAKQAIGAGEKVSADDLAITRINGGQGLSTFATIEEVVGKQAASDIASGTLLNPAALADTPALAPGWATVTVGLKHSSMPATGLHAGEGIRLVTQIPAGQTKTAQAWDGVVAAVGERGDDQMRVVDVTARAQDAAQIATNPTGTLAVVVTAPDTSVPAPTAKAGAPATAAPRPAVVAPAAPAPAPTPAKAP